MGRDDSVCSRPYYIIVMVFMHTYVANVIALLLYVHFHEPAPRPALNTASAPAQPWARSRLRPEGVKMGFVQALHLGGGVDDLHIRTLSLKPLLFEIPKFLSHEETQLLIALAQLRGLRGTNSAKFQQEAPDTQYDGMQARLHLFQLLDRNQDSKLQPVEVCDHVHLTSGLWLTSLELLHIYNTLGIDTDVHGCVGQESFLLLTPNKLWTVLNGVWPQEDSSLEKYARSTWLQLDADAHQLLQAIWNRLVRASRLPPTYVGPPQALQVLRFDIGAMYHTHGDVEGTEGSPKPPPCESPTHFKQWEQREQAPPRYITAILYLTNITEGGETMFPVADNQTYNAQDTLPLLEASHACEHGNLRISPQAGSLLLWYNYLPDGKGWVGEQDEFGLHTGCPVKQGMKWIAVARIGLCLPHDSPATLGSHLEHQAKEMVESELDRKPETSLEKKVDGEVEQRRSEL
uniref:transmembrane prolyl 4-hydroxylase n=1 Tax=Myxine glutinosa TaxID=7769 RepID=UPI00358FAE62